MSWLAAYLAVALIVSGGSFLAAQWVVDQHVPSPDRPGIVALAIGAAWPVLFAGGVQLAAVVVARRLLTGPLTFSGPQRSASMASGHADV